MAEQSRERVGVYIDFDNIVISRYSQLHGRTAWAKDRVRQHDSSKPDADPQVTERIKQATIDLAAILEYASSFGSIVISRAYADWSAAVNADYQQQLIDRAVDLVQLFPTVRSLKNGADIRLAVDVVEDVFRLDDLTHIVIVAGDSDYIPLAQRCKRLGRYVVGIGVSGATSSSLAAACDEFADYDTMPGISSSRSVPGITGNRSSPGTGGSRSVHTIEFVAPAASTGSAPIMTTDAAAPEPAKGRAAKGSAEKEADKQVDKQSDHEGSDDEERATPKERKAATALLLRAMELLAKNDLEWQHASAVKNQMRRMDPAFQEQALGYRQFSDFLKSRHNVVELEQESPSSPIMLRLRG
ncbi:NYN domain-containing protein [Leifsonia kafniensis]|uniref:NYN domain-containing protein n=1 Tax=Leifsonia kafniensis TaxID=475957 RepID=A0ABP7KV48_9MICO